MASTASVTMYRGEEVLLNFTLVPVEDISGWTILLTVAKAQDSATKYFAKAGAIVDAVNGEFSVAIDPVDTAGLKAGSYFYDVWRMDAGAERVLAAGAFVVTGNARLPIP